MCILYEEWHIGCCFVQKSEKLDSGSWILRTEKLIFGVFKESGRPFSSTVRHRSPENSKRYPDSVRRKRSGVSSADAKSSSKGESQPLTAL